MEKRTQEEISKDFQREFAKDQFPECGGEDKIEENPAWVYDPHVRCGGVKKKWEWTPENVCTECHLG